MEHATIDVTQNVYNRTWWKERVEAVSMAAATMSREFRRQPVPAMRMLVLLEVLDDPAILQVLDWSALADDFRTFLQNREF